MNPKYRFFLQLNGGGEKIAANPVFNDDMTLDYELESNQRFYRAKLSGNFTFVRNDFAIIMGASFDTVYYLYIEKSDDWGQTWTQYYKAMFMRTDCTINVDDQTIKVKPQPTDQYNDILAGLEKEYNLIQLAPEIKRVTLKKRPLIQIYIPGESVVSCFLSGLSWEQDCEVVNETDVDSEGRRLLEYKYYYAIVHTIEWRNMFNLSGDNPLGIEGKYVNTSDSIYINGNGYKLDVSTNELRDKNNNLLYILEAGQVLKSVTNPDNRIVYSQPGYTNIYARYLLDVETFLGLDTYELPIDDMVGNNRNYRRAIGYAVSGVVQLSTRLSDEPTEYGLAENGKYFLPPYSIYQQKYYPIARTQWENYSIWFAFHLFDESFEVAGRKAYTLRDCYPISSILSVLLAQIAPGITHEAEPGYSRFLYRDENPLTGIEFRLFATPKSNILIGDYQTPVQRALVTLRQILDMLRNTFQLYWHIEDDKLCIEHISWYKNGGTYDGNPVIGYDLTALENIRNGKKWAFGTSEYTFDKEDMPERYQFKWADEVTEPFEGQPIQIISNYVQPGKIEEINIGGFSSDIDLMLLNPEQFSQEGFALLAAQYNYDSQQYELPFVRRDVDNVTYYLQNGLVAMVNLQPQYWLYDMPARELIVNGVQVWAYGIQRRKSQTLTFPVGDDVPDLLQFVKTYIGNGQYEKLSINLSSRTAEATLKYDTE